MSFTIKELEQKLKGLQKLKKAITKKHPAEKKKVDKRIKTLKEEMKEKKKQSGNNPLIKRIYQLKPHLKEIGIDLTLYDDIQLQKHLDRILDKNYVPLLDEWKPKKKRGGIK